MPVLVEYNARQFKWQSREKTITLCLPLPWLRGAQGETLLPDAVLSVRTEQGLLIAETQAYRLIAAKVSIQDGVVGVTRRLYQRILEQAQTKPLLRIWNFVPQINRWVEGEENYRSFCTGRAQGFASSDFWESGVFPAASAVGCEGDEVIIYALAALHGDIEQMENPLQVPAYQYPSEYGVDAPAFARAAATSDTLCISGTASVRGHETQFPDDLDAQLKVSAENVRALLDAYESRYSGLEQGMAPLVRVYLRHADDAERVEAWLKSEGWATAGRYSIVQADICRSDLLAEVELSWIGRQSISPDLDVCSVAESTLG